MANCSVHSGRRYCPLVHWEAEAQDVESRTRARSTVIQAAESMLDQGVRPAEILGWQDLLSRTGLSVEELDRELHQLGSIADVAASEETRANRLRLEVSRLDGEVRGLEEQRNKIQGEVHAIGHRALAELKSTRQQIVQELKESGHQAREEIGSLIAAASENALLREESSTLREYIQIARSLRSNSPKIWQAMPRTVIQHLLLGVAAWAQEEGRNPELPPPAVVRQSTLLQSWNKVCLSNLLLWSLCGVFTPEEREALATGW